MWNGESNDYIQENTKGGTCNCIIAGNADIFTSEHYDKKYVPHRKISDADVKTFNAQYPKPVVRYNESFHDRFLIIDDKELFLIGASLKDLGSKCFAFTKLDPAAIRRIKKAAFHPEANR